MSLPPLDVVQLLGKDVADQEDFQRRRWLSPEERVIGEGLATINTASKGQLYKSAGTST
jgi:hypothetical protein